MGFVSAGTAQNLSSAGTSLSDTGFSLSGGSNRIVVALATAEDANASVDGVVSSITFDGVNMTDSGEGTVHESGLTTAVYYMLESSLPSSGTYTCTVTWAGTCDKGTLRVIEYDGMDQTAPDWTGSASANSAAPGPTVEAVTSVDGSFVFVAGGSTSGGATASGNSSDYTVDNEAYYNGTGHSHYYGSGDVPSAGTVTAGAAWDTAAGMINITMVLAPAASGNTPLLQAIGEA